MAECCTDIHSVACNELVDIAYLRSLISCMTNSSGGALSVPSGNGYGDGYRPTKSEIEAAIGVANTKSSGNWDSNVDGVIISSSVSANSPVRKSEITGYCTSFKSLVITASTSNISECGGCAQASYTFTLTQKTMTCGSNGSISTSSSDGTGNVSSWSPNWTATSPGSTTQTGYFCFDKNMSFSEATSTQTLNITWRGQSKSASFTHRQTARTHSYREDNLYYTNVTVTMDNDSFGCLGGTANATEYYSYAYEYVYYDTCGDVYDTTYGNNSGSGSNYLGSETHGCEESTVYWTAHSNSGYYDRYGNSLSDYATASWYCPSCASCNDTYQDYTATGITVNCDGSGTIYGTATRISYTKNDAGDCVSASSASTSVTEEITGCSASDCTCEEDSCTKTFYSEHMSMSGTQSGCKNCSCEDIQWDTATTLTWAADSTAEQEIGYTASCGSVSASTNCNDKWTVTIDTAKSVVKVNPKEANSGTEAKTCTLTLSFNPGSGECSDKKQYTLTQNKPTPGCTCEDIEWSTATTLTWAADSTADQYIPYTASCGSVSASTNCNDKWNVTVESANSRVKVSPKATNTSTTDDKTCTLTLAFDPGSGECSDKKQYTLKQNKVSTSCTYANFTATTTGQSWCCEQTSWTLVGEMSATCGSISAFTYSTDWLEVSSTTVNGKTLVYARTKKKNEGTEVWTGTTYLAFDDGSGYNIEDANKCKRSTITVDRCVNCPSPCTCSSASGTMSADTTSLSFSASDTTSNTKPVKVSASCGTFSAVTTGDFRVDGGTSSTGSSTSHTFNISTIGANTGAAKSGTLNIYLMIDGVPCTSANTINISQGGGGCTCNDALRNSYSASTTGVGWDYNAFEDREVKVSASCGVFSATTSAGFKVTPTTANASSAAATVFKVSPNPQQANNSTTEKKGTLTIKLLINATDTTECKKDEIELYQGKKPCDISISASTTSLTCSGGTVTFKVV